MLIFTKQKSSYSAHVREMKIALIIFRILLGVFVFTVENGAPSLQIYEFSDCAALTGANCLRAQPESKKLRKFPDGFIFGTATASYQVEGAWNVSDKGENIWDHMTHTEPWRVAQEENGDIADESFNNYKRDVQMMRELGIDFYRFSLSWARILPTGFVNQISGDGVAYYNNLINEMLKYNIKPMITLYHWDLPQKLQDLGGWSNPLIVEWFADYARVAFYQFGDRVKTWFTFNEPDSVCHHGYGDVNKAPALDAHGIAEYLCAHSVAKAHAKAFHIYDEEFRSKQEGRVGYVVSTHWSQPASESKEDIQAADDNRQFSMGIFTHPIFSSEGDFPAVVKKRVGAKSAAQGYPRSRLPEFTAEDVDYIRGTYDFLGINHYTTEILYRNSSVNGLYKSPSWQEDAGAGAYQNPSWPSSASSWLKVEPTGIRKMLKWLKYNYNDPEILITENGFSSRGGLHDDDRVSYYRLYLNSVLDAIYEDEVNVTAYTAWSLMDNFEWMEGYTEKFGLYEVDYSSPLRTRTPRKSALVYKEIIRSKLIDPDYEPDTLTITID